MQLKSDSSLLFPESGAGLIRGGRLDLLIAVLCIIYLLVRMTWVPLVAFGKFLCPFDQYRRYGFFYGFLDFSITKIIIERQSADVCLNKINLDEICYSYFV